MSKFSYKKSCAPILFFDSGIGGLTTLASTVVINPNNNYLYFADYLNLPYGQKSITSLRQIILMNVNNLVEKFCPQTMVIACNTITATCIEALRYTFPSVNIIGTEPAITLASKRAKKGVLVLATPNTIKYCKILKNTYNIPIFYAPMPNLANQIECNVSQLKVVFEKLKFLLACYIDRVDVVVLGCTHFVLLKNLMQEEYGKIFQFLDGNAGVAKRVNTTTKYKLTHSGKITFVTNTKKSRKKLEEVWDILQKEEINLCAE